MTDPIRDRNVQGDTVTSCPTKHTAVVIGQKYSPALHVFVGVGGDVEVEDDVGVILTYSNISDGSILPIRATRVISTTASGLIGIY